MSVFVPRPSTDQIDIKLLECYSDVPGVARVTVTQEMVTNAPLNHGVPVKPTPGAEPAYTLDDVKAYFETHPLIAGLAIPGTTVVMTRLEFMTHEQAKAALHNVPLNGQGRAGGTVCLVQFAGTFDLWAPRGPFAGKVAYTHQTYLVLSPWTGQHIRWGFFESFPTPD